jgi:hypothetical protein
MIFSECDGQLGFKDSNLFSMLRDIAQSRRTDSSEHRDTVTKPSTANRFKFDFDWSEDVEEEEQQRSQIPLVPLDSQPLYFWRKTVLTTIVEEEG